MKHFEIIYFVGNHAFTWECTTAYEALEAVSDIMAHDNRGHYYDDKMDELMKDIVEMKSGKKLSIECRVFKIRYVDGEV